MTVAVIGCTGRTGSLVVEQALARGLHVVAVARHAEPTGDDRIRYLSADVLDRAAMVRVLDGVDAVVSAVGIGASRDQTVLYSDGVANILHGMRTHSITALSVVSAAPVGPRTAQPFLQRRLVMPVLDRFFGATYADMRLMEAELERSEVNWVSLRPPRLVTKPLRGAYRLDAHHPLPRSGSITHGDLATALLDCVAHPPLVQQAAYVAN